MKKLREGIKTYPLSDRDSLVDVDALGRPQAEGASFGQWLEGLPRILAGKSIRRLADAVLRAHRNGRPVLAGLGGHVIKTGCSPYLIDLARRGLISGIVFNGSVMIHDFEIAFAGKTSEDVAAALGKGEFGMAQETAHYLNDFISKGIEQGLGLGTAVGRGILELKPKYLEASLLAAAAELEIPACAVVALGTDILHMHPDFPAQACATGCMRDFDLLADVVSGLDGGVYMNIGSAVLLPEAFLKAISIARNTSDTPREFVTANLDFIQHYRPIQNVITRPVSDGGEGIAITGHHEIILPILHQIMIENLSR